MQKTIIVRPIEDPIGEGLVYVLDPDDEYCRVDFRRDYCDQFYNPYIDECVDFIDKMMQEKHKVYVGITINDEKGANIYSKILTPSITDYLGDHDDEFDETLWNSRDLGTLIVSVNIFLDH